MTNENRTEDLKDPEFKKEWDKLEEAPEFKKHQPKLEKVGLGLSEKENALLELIKTSTEKVTLDVITEKLDKGSIGALGKLLNSKLIEGKKDRRTSEEDRFKKLVKYYVIKNNEIKDI